MIATIRMTPWEFSRAMLCRAWSISPTVPVINVQPRIANHIPSPPRGCPDMTLGIAALEALTGSGDQGRVEEDDHVETAEVRDQGNDQVDDVELGVAGVAESVKGAGGAE